jgi:hypothetical protein
VPIFNNKYIANNSYHNMIEIVRLPIGFAFYVFHQKREIGHAFFMDQDAIL